MPEKFFILSNFFTLCWSISESNFIFPTNAKVTWKYYGHLILKFMAKILNSTNLYIPIYFWRFFFFKILMMKNTIKCVKNESHYTE